MNKDDNAIMTRETALALAIQARNPDENTGVTLTRAKKFFAFLSGSKDE